jgi:hypothetical protein
MRSNFVKSRLYFSVKYHSRIIRVTFAVVVNFSMSSLFMYDTSTVIFVILLCNNMLCGGGINLSIIKFRKMMIPNITFCCELIVDVLKNEDKKRTHLFQKLE